MAMLYLREGMLASATFSLFVRDLPPDRGRLEGGPLRDRRGGPAPGGLLAAPRPRPAGRAASRPARRHGRHPTRPRARRRGGAMAADSSRGRACLDAETAAHRIPWARSASSAGRTSSNVSTALSLSASVNACSFRAATARTVPNPGGSVALPRGSSTPRAVRRARAPSRRGLPSTSSRYSRSASKGSCAGRPVPAAQAWRQPSKANFHAPACSAAESRRTPSVSRTTARNGLTA